MPSIFVMPPRVAFFFAVVLHCLTVTVLCDNPTKVFPPNVRILDPTNPFRENLSKNISSEDPILQDVLWAGRNREPTRTVKRGPKILEYKLNNPKDKNLAKRANYGPNPYGPLIDFKGCLFCQGQAKRTNQMSVAQNFMADQMIAKMSLFATIGSCLFCRRLQSYNSYKNCSQYSVDGQRPPGFTNPRSLSVPASDYACSFGGLAWRTIWHLWPSEGCDTDENYYCLNPREPGCCWLNPLMPGQTQDERIRQSMLYFQQMSRAMALTCTGEVFILIDNPTDVPVQQPDPYPSIWLSHELPALQGLYETGVVTKLTAIRFSDKQRFDRTIDLQRRVPRGIDWDEPIAKAVKAKKLELLRSGFYNNMTEENIAKLQRRDGPCGSAADQEAPGLSYFG